MQQVHRDAAQTLLALTPQERVAIMQETENVLLSEAEDIKNHPMRSHSLPADQWEVFCAHMEDGGGVLDRHALGLSIADRLHNRDQDPRFWGDLVHYIKACLKGDRHIRPISGGGVELNGVANRKV